MGVYESIYEGGGYSLDSKYGMSLSDRYQSPTRSFALALDPRTANQLKETSNKLNTGAKQVEFQGTFSKIFESIPEGHLDETRRQAKLVGAKITFHGPLGEPSGFIVGQQGETEWREINRVHVEKQFIQAVERAHKLDPNGNIIVTLHSTNQLPEMLQREKIGGKEVIKSMFVVDSRTGRVGPLKEEQKYFPQEKGEKKYVFNPENELKRLNKDVWLNELRNAAYYLDLSERRAIGKQIPEEIKSIYEEIESGKAKFEDVVQKHPDLREELMAMKEGRRVEEIYIRNAYQELKKLYDQAYHSALELKNENDIKKLNEFRDLVNKNWDKIEGEENSIEVLRKVVESGVDTLESIKNPQIFKPFQEFVIEKSSETFSNVALSSFKKFGDNSPIISIENPPAGEGISRAEDMKKLIDESREKFSEKLKKEGYSKEEAKKIAEKLIGATWDVGHINMIRRFGYEKEDILKEAKIIKPYLKHIHLSDNFGFEHTELPMGMGNVPLKETAKIFGDKFNKITKAIETGDWYQHFQISPFKYELEAFGSPVTSDLLDPRWNQISWGYAPYFVGYGTINPDIHHSIYGRGFANLPQELSGQIPGKESSRVTGTPLA